MFAGDCLLHSAGSHGLMLFKLNGVANALQKDIAETESMIVWSNPVHEYLMLFSDCLHYNIFDNSGRLVIQGISNKNSIPLAHLQSGIYFLQITQPDHQIFKFVKN